LDPFAAHARRLVIEPGPATWIGLVVCVALAQEREATDRILRLPAHYLGAAWPPFEIGPSRWPECVVIGSPRADNAIVELFARLPADAKLFLADSDAVDGALAGQILLASDRNLEPYQREAINAYVASERARTAARIASDYHDRDAGFERFRASVLASDEDRRTKP